jgi:hypothetical protein
VTGGESTLAGNEVMNKLKEIPSKWKGETYFVFF